MDPYRPSNGTEGLMFIEDFCSRCKKDDTFRHEDPDSWTLRCDILTRSFIHSPGDADYPKEWVWDPEGLKRDGCMTIGDGGARCTAFEEEK